nr:MAG TPA: hypothetical protein [Caudoviricetes sp.]
MFGWGVTSVAPRPFFYTSPEPLQSAKNNSKKTFQTMLIYLHSSNKSSTFIV